ncbi:MAG: hypothetical protein LUI02_02190 [Clostridiales bacterium]|nr:hypothetical protein [Clostridiales bacterium]
MGKMKELSQILDEMIEAGNGMIESANSLKEYLSSTDAEGAAAKPKKTETPAAKPAAPAKEKKPEPELTLEDVRRRLTAMSNVDEGKHRQSVKALVKKYADGGNLSDVRPEKYGELLSELEVIGNA